MSSNSGRRGAWSGHIRKNFTRPFNLQLLKWVGNKQRFAHEIVAWFPDRFGTYFEPFLGSGGVLGSLAPQNAVGSDSFEPLI
jgi:DNA adenine methylase